MRIFSIPGSEAIVSIDRCSPSRSFRSMYSVVPCLITSLIRSATSNVFCSRCWRCKRTVRYPSRAKIATIALSKRMFSLALRVCVALSNRARVGSVTGMLHYRGCERNRKSRVRSVAHLHAVLREDRQVLHRHAKKCEAHRNDHQRDRELGPLGDVMMPNVGLETDQADIQAIGDKSEQADDRCQVQAMGRKPNLFKAEKNNGNEESERQFQPQEISLVAWPDHLSQQSPVKEIFEPEQRVHP